MERPAETLQVIIGNVIGAAMILSGVLKNGFDFSSLNQPEVLGAITLLTSYISAAVTWWKARKQRAGEISSGVDGKVLPA